MSLPPSTNNLPRLKLFVAGDRAIDLNGDGTTKLRPPRFSARLVLTGLANGRPTKGATEAPTIYRCDIPNADTSVVTAHEAHHHATREEAIDCGEKMAIACLEGYYPRYQRSVEYWIELKNVAAYRWEPEDPEGLVERGVTVIGRQQGDQVVSVKTGRPLVFKDGRYQEDE